MKGFSPLPQNFGRHKPTLILLGKEEKERRLTLGELETLPRTRLTRLLTLFGAGISAKHSFFFQSTAQLRICFDQGASDSEANGSDLSIWATAVGVDLEIELVDQVGDLKRLQKVVLQGDGWEIVFEATSVDDDFAFAFSHSDAGYRRFASSCCLVYFSHDFKKG